MVADATALGQAWSAFKHAWLVRLVERKTLHLFVRDPDVRVREYLETSGYKLIRIAPWPVFIYRRQIP